MKALNDWIHRENYFGIGTADGAKGNTRAAQRGIEYHRRVFRALAGAPIDGWRLVVEPWLQERTTGRFRQPDAVLVHDEDRLGIVVEVKLNWADGRADKLLQTYLPAVRSAFKLELTWPLLVTANIRGYQHPPLLGFTEIMNAMAWEPGAPCPLLLHP
jgi:hypothetical protein